MRRSRPSVLVAAENDRLAKLYRVWLRSGGFSVTSADSLDATPVQASDRTGVVVTDREGVDQSSRSVESIRERLDASVVFTCTLDRVFDALEYPFDDYFVEPTSKSAVVGTVSRVLRRMDRDGPIRTLARPLTSIALVRQGTSVDERTSNDRYRDVVDRFLDLYAEWEGRVQRLADDRLRELFGPGDRANLLRHPTATLDV